MRASCERLAERVLLSASLSRRGGEGSDEASDESSNGAATSARFHIVLKQPQQASSSPLDNYCILKELLAKFNFSPVDFGSVTHLLLVC